MIFRLEYVILYPIYQIENFFRINLFFIMKKIVFVIIISFVDLIMS